MTPGALRVLLSCGEASGDLYAAALVRALRADDPTAAPRLLLARREGMEYTVAHHDGSFYILTNLDAPNFRLVRASVDD